MKQRRQKEAWIWGCSLRLQDEAVKERGWGLKLGRVPPRREHPGLVSPPPDPQIWVEAAELFWQIKEGWSPRWESVERVLPAGELMADLHGFFSNTKEARESGSYRCFEMSLTSWGWCHHSSQTCFSLLRPWPWQRGTRGWPGWQSLWAVWTNGNKWNLLKLSIIGCS